MEVAGLASSITRACGGRGGSFVIIEATFSELAGLVPRVCPIPLNGTYLGSGGACNSQHHHQEKTTESESINHKVPSHEALVLCF